jgi:hypothetical protein
MRSLGKKIRGVFEAAAIVAPCPRADQQQLRVGHHLSLAYVQTGGTARARLWLRTRPEHFIAVFTTRVQAPIPDCSGCFNSLEARTRLWMNVGGKKFDGPWPRRQPTECCRPPLSQICLTQKARRICAFLAESDLSKSC